MNITRLPSNHLFERGDCGWFQRVSTGVLWMKRAQVTKMEIAPSVVELGSVERSCQPYGYHPASKGAPVRLEQKKQFP
ncbi:hypothetical protein M404DRAFT_993410 [Pisolithus tinctorius Marx 270]|uniref:Uncharacterized protein n=1 Tax=Pisolithus tinctorius Marx 270 TaxID=870435 RepID=A0A0C3PUE2_PISTI|nr:hypothetical protein M404DRAFT_993410 [Pisolithus tinctorius Marx 270]